MNRKNIESQVLFSVSLLAWIATATQLILLAMPGRAIRYDLDIYSGLDSIYWIALVASTVFHVFLVIVQCIASRPKGHYAYLGIAGNVVNTISLMSLPFLRGYYTLNGDFGTHLSAAGAVASTGNFDLNNFYPALYGLVQVLHVISGIDISGLWFIGGTLFYTLSVGFAMIIGRGLFKEERYGFWLGLVASIPAAGGYLYPMFPASVSVQFLLLLFFLYASSKEPGEIGFRILLLLLSILYPFIHPLTALMGIFWLTLIEVSMWLINHRVMKRQTKLVLNPSVLLGVTWFMWFSSFALLRAGVQSVTNWLAGEASNQLSQLALLVGRSKLPVWDSLFLAFKQESGVILLVGFSTLSIIYFLYKAFRAHRAYENTPLLLAILFLIVGSAVFVLFGLLGPFEGLDIYRFARFLIPWSAIGLVVAAHLIRSVHRSKMPLVALFGTSLISVVVLLGDLAMHPSPFVFQPNVQVTLQDVACYRWLSQNWQDGRSVQGIWGTARLATIILGRSEAQRLNASYTQFPDHFGYDVHSSIEENYVYPFYLVITESDKQTVLDLWKIAGKFTDKDFQMLNYDPSINLIYSNENCEVWMTQK